MYYDPPLHESLIIVKGPKASQLRLNALCNASGLAVMGHARLYCELFGVGPTVHCVSVNGRAFPAGLLSPV